MCVNGDETVPYRMNLIGLEVFPSGPFALFVDSCDNYPLEVLRSAQDTAFVQNFQNLSDFLPLSALKPTAHRYPVDLLRKYRTQRIWR